MRSHMNVPRGLDKTRHDKGADLGGARPVVRVTRDMDTQYELRRSLNPSPCDVRASQKVSDRVPCASGCTMPRGSTTIRIPINRKQRIPPLRPQVPSSRISYVYRDCDPSPVDVMYNPTMHNVY